MTDMIVYSGDVLRQLVCSGDKGEDFELVLTKKLKNYACLFGHPVRLLEFQFRTIVLNKFQYFNSDQISIS